MGMYKKIFVNQCGYHHRPSGFVGKAMPGMLSGGPCSWIGDETAKQVLMAETLQ